MAGTDPNFDATLFRDSIHTAMRMGMPSDPTQQATFVFDEQRTFAVEDPRDLPYDWTEAVRTTTGTIEVSVPYAVQWAVESVAADEMGQFDNSRGTITLLDVDYAKVKGCNEVIINGFHYVIEAWGPPEGLFSVTIYSAHIAARG